MFTESHYRQFPLCVSCDLPYGGECAVDAVVCERCQPVYEWPLVPEWPLMRPTGA